MTLKKLTLPELLKVSCAKFAQRLSLNFVANGKRTYQDLYNEVMAVARHLLRIGVRKGDKVAILSANMPNWGIAQFAIAQTGAVTVPILPGFSATELQNILEHAEVKVIFVSRLLAKQLETVKTPLLKHKILLSFGEAITEEQSKARGVIGELDATDFFLETDESALPIDYIYKVAAELRDCDVETLKEQIAENFKRVFGK